MFFLSLHFAVHHYILLELNCVCKLVNRGEIFVVFFGGFLSFSWFAWVGV